MILGRFIEQINAECLMQERQPCSSKFSNYLPVSIVLSRFWSITLPLSEMSLLLYGNDSFSLETNTIIFEKVHKFILDSKLF